MFNFPSHLAAPKVYGKREFRQDVLAGLTLAVLLIPQGMAYAILAGVPPIYGIYASLAPMLVYALLGSSPHVSVGPTALASILSISVLSQMEEPNTAAYLEAILLLAAMSGVIQLLFGLFRLGVLVSFLSRPVINGFVSAAAILIIFSQVKDILGLSLGRSQHFYQLLLEIARNLGTAHLFTALVGVGSILALYVLQRWQGHRWPVTFFWLLITGLAAAIFNWENVGIKLIGDLPSGIPAFSLPTFQLSQVYALLPMAFVLALISFVETLSIGKTLAENHDYYDPLPNRELLALGVSKIVGAFFQAIPTSASFSRSAVNEQNGAKTFISSLVAFVILLLAGAFIMSLFEPLPISVLAAIIILSVRNLFDVAEMRRLWQQDKRDWAAWVVTFLFTLFGGLQIGISAGILLSLSFFIMKSARPHIAELGRIPGTNAFRNIERFPEALVEEHILLARFDGELYFGNADFFLENLQGLIRRKGGGLQLVVLDAHTIHSLDTSGAYILKKLLERLQQKQVDFYLVGAIGPVRDKLYQMGIMTSLGPDRQFLSVQDALTYFKSQGGDNRDWQQPALQHS